MISSLRLVQRGIQNRRCSGASARRMPPSRIAKQSGGFTLMELLVTISIIAILAALLFPVIGSALRKMEEGRAKAEIASIYSAVTAFYQAYGRLPVASSQQGGGDQFYDGANSRGVIMALLGGDPAINPRNTAFLETGNAQTNGTFSDPWGTQYALKLDNNYDGVVEYYGNKNARVIVISYGPDGSQGDPDSSDDLVSYEL